MPVFVGAQSSLGILLDEVARDAKELVPSLWDVGFLCDRAEDKEDIESGGSAKRKKGERELHVSLSRPTYLRAHQREELKRAVKTLAEAHAPYVSIYLISAPTPLNVYCNYYCHRFKASFAAFSELTNDERTRTFLTLEVGAGHSEVSFLFVSRLDIAIKGELYTHLAVLPAPHSVGIINTNSPLIPPKRILYGPKISCINRMGSFREAH